MAKTRPNIRKLTDDDVRLARQLNEDAEERILNIEAEIMVLRKQIFDAKRRIRSLNSEKAKIEANFSLKQIAGKWDISTTAMDNILKYKTYVEVQ